MANKETPNQNLHNEIELPQSVIDSFARFLVPEIRKFYESEKGQREFAGWREQQESEILSDDK